MFPKSGAPLETDAHSIALHIFRGPQYRSPPQLHMSGQRHALAHLPPGNYPSTHLRGCGIGPTAGAGVFHHSLVFSLRGRAGRNQSSVM